MRKLLFVFYVLILFSCEKEDMIFAQAENDFVETTENSSVSVDAISNDKGKNIRFDGIITPPMYGEVIIKDGKLIYTPDVDYNGNDTFSYQIRDAFGNYDTASISIIIKNK